jgi:hypothetical protein
MSVLPGFSRVPWSVGAVVSAPWVRYTTYIPHTQGSLNVVTTGKSVLSRAHCQGSPGITERLKIGALGLYARNRLGSDRHKNHYRRARYVLEEGWCVFCWLVTNAPSRSKWCFERGGIDTRARIA